ncbi:MAG: hypothetical protein U1E60_23030 [Reyranellaceae bacterium]
MPAFTGLPVAAQRMDDHDGRLAIAHALGKGAIASVDRDARRPMLALRNGLRVPVGTTFRDQVREAGWLA